MPCYPSNRPPKRLIRRFQDLMDTLGACAEGRWDQKRCLTSGKTRFPLPAHPIQLQLGEKEGKRLQLYPEIRLTDEGKPQRTGALLLADGEPKGIQGFLRLCPGDTVLLGRGEIWQQGLLRYPKSVASRHLKIKYSAKGLVCKPLSQKPAYLAPLSEGEQPLGDPSLRCDRLRRLLQLFGGPLEPLPRAKALALLQGVLRRMESEPCQALDARGRPGGVLNLPPETLPFFIGDLHGRLDNLLVILTQNGFLEGLERGTATLIFLGDAVHPDESGREEEMDSSMLLMDFILCLKLRFPEQVFYLRGNHDGFSEEISKGGVPQGLLWRKALHQVRGAKYVQAMDRLYELLPYFALSKRFIACHAGPPSAKVSLETLINIRDHPRILREITHVRLRRPNSPSGYHQGEVKRFRRHLGLDEKTPFIVGHTPLSPDDTLWLQAGGIPHHHVLFGAHPHLIGTLVLMGKHLLPMRYPTEPLVTLGNRLLKERNKISYNACSV